MSPDLPVSSNKDQENSQPKYNITLKNGMQVKFLGHEPDAEWFEGTLMDRAGKSKGKYKNTWNILRDGEKEHIDFDRDVSTYKVVHLYQHKDEIQPDIIFLSTLENETIKAKQKELESWKLQKVFTEAENVGQKAISTRWYLNQKQ